MKKASESTIQFVNFSVRESHIVFNEEGRYKLNLAFNPQGFIFTDLNQFHLLLDVLIKDENDMFHIDLKTVSVFDYPADANLEEYKDSYFILNAPAIVFPYLRAYVTSLTALSGMPTLVLPTLNLSGIGEQLKSNIKEVID